MFSQLLTLAVFLSSAVAVPTPTTALSESQLVAIAPKSSSCATAQFASECRTAAQAVGPISASFITYNITDPGEQAAILSTISFESDDFQYQINHFPGVPGQGTRNSKALSLLSSPSLSLTPFHSPNTPLLRSLSVTRNADSEACSAVPTI